MVLVFLSFSLILYFLFRIPGLDRNGRLISNGSGGSSNSIGGPGGSNRGRGGFGGSGGELGSPLLGRRNLAPQEWI